MTYRVGLRKTDEGYSVWCPGLPGCWSQGVSREDALENIRSAIQEYLDAGDDLLTEPGNEIAEVTV